MRLYRIAYQNTTEWFGTKREYRARRNELVKSEHVLDNETGEADVPTDKAGLLAFLNTGETE